MLVVIGVLFSANNISKEISLSGHIAIYDIHFDGDKASIKPESAEAFTIVADFDMGMRLSEARAKAVMDELVTKFGIDKGQLKSYGVGALCPIASNNTDEGVVKNRRVEIVEQ